MVFSTGRRESGPLLRVIGCPGTGMVGIATVKKIGGKPQRNQAKRRVRESLRVQSALVDQRMDYVIVVSTEGAKAPFERLQDEMRNLLPRVVKRWESELESSLSEPTK